ncbi:hypothetical protein [Hymenobacter sp. HDW8]|uniref:hypothetical protein n=1 Tax=Hymenobacter sp. HDW8 TaxID=2714932 RepID=UPI0014079D10|nr:hypothetical protein [Hymenobacter sp. HDW8]QIL74876.1 hypothetical protein G7064_02640 [Hymenobacter sp. HDW8]
MQPLRKGLPLGAFLLKIVEETSRLLNSTYVIAVEIISWHYQLLAEFWIPQFGQATFRKMKSIKIIAVRLALLLVLLSCGILYNPIDVDIPPTYQGWIFLIPVKDTTNFQFNIKNGSYQANSYGVAYIPYSLIKTDFKVNLYQNGSDIQSKTKYGGLVQDYLNTDSIVHTYVEFYLPPLKEQDIPASDEYWRLGRGVLHREVGRKRFKDLIRSGQISFK